MHQISYLCQYQLSFTISSYKHRCVPRLALTAWDIPVASGSISWQQPGWCLHLLIYLMDTSTSFAHRQTNATVHNTWSEQQQQWTQVQTQHCPLHRHQATDLVPDPVWGWSSVIPSIPQRTLLFFALSLAARPGTIGWTFRGALALNAFRSLTPRFSLYVCTSLGEGSYPTKGTEFHCKRNDCY